MSSFLPSHPLYSASVKCDRAKVHINALKRSIRFHERDPFGLNSKKNRRVGQPVEILGRMPLAYLDYPRTRPGHILLDDDKSPILWAAILSDAANNLRASLDFLTHQLALKHIANRGLTIEPDEVSFPICSNPGDKKGQFQWVVKHHLSVVLPSAIPVMESFQPYPGTSGSNNHLLIVLRELSNKTKHRFFIQPYLVGGVPGNLWGNARLKRFHNGDIKFVATRTNSKGEQEEFEPKLPFEVHIEIPSLTPTKYDISLLDDIHKFVRDDILPAFATFF